MKKTSFSWLKKASSSIEDKKRPLKAFEENEVEESELEEDIDWLTASKRPKVRIL